MRKKTPESPTAKMVYDFTLAGLRRPPIMISEQPPIFSAYEYAIVRLATCVPGGTASDNKNREPLLVFASLELVTADRPPPDTMPLDANDLPPHVRCRKSNFTIYFRRIAARASDALAWYRDAAVGKLSPPLAADPRDRGRHDENPLRAPNLTESRRGRI